jgi:RNA polymerase sigma factor (sigma-70 family)
VTSDRRHGVILRRVTPSDQELLEQWRAGDPTAGNQLFLRYFAAVRRFFANKVPVDDVEDLLQKTFAGCVEARERVRGDGGLRSFVFCVAHRQLCKFLRDRATAARRTVDLSVSSVRDLGQTPTSIIAHARSHALVLEALQSIAVDYQTILELFYWDELSGAEIAEVLEIPQATVRTRLFRARAALLAVLTRLGGTADDGPALDGALRAAGEAGR